MPRLTQLSLTQFKNYDIAHFNFTEKVIGICGLNGKGKTNLLDAIYYLCFTKSYFTKTDPMNVQFGKEGFRLEGIFENGRIVCIHRSIAKKEFYLNDIPYTKFSGHIGKFPAVMIAPDDIELITGGSETRRRFLDTVLSQTDAQYLQHLISYNKVLQQRNSLLKKFAEQDNKDWQLLEVLDEQLMFPGSYIHRQRTAFTISLIPMIQEFYRQIAGGKETVTLQYDSQLNNNGFKPLLDQYRDKDILLQRSNAGIHKDDIAVQLNGQIFRNCASQGQRKSLLFAMKLAEFEMLKLHKREAPLLLLDDVFEKLDDRRMSHLLHGVCIENEGQVFITDTHKERLEAAFSQLQIAFQLVEL